MKIEIKGAIISNDDKWIYDWFEMDATSPKQVISQLDSLKNNEPVDVEINSGGGDLYAGAEIYTALKDYAGEVTTKIVGIAASAASLIAMAGDKVTMSPPAQFMAHNVSVNMYGNRNDLSDAIPFLKGHDEGLAYVYMTKTGKSQKEIMTLMDNEVYFNAKSALDNGFIDEIMFDETPQVLNKSVVNVLQPEIINKVRNLIKKDENRADPPEPVSDISNEEPEKPDLSQQNEKFKKLKLKLLGGK